MKMTIKKLAMYGAAWLAGLSLAGAELVLEFDFRTAADGTTVTASYARDGLAGTGTLLNAATINTGAAASGLGYAGLQTGFLAIAARTNNMTTAAHRRDMFAGGANRFGTGTIVMVLKPTDWFNNTAVGASSREYLWQDSGTYSPGGRNSIGLADISEGVQLAGGRSGDLNNFSLTLDLAGFTYDTQAWYLIGSSWQESSGAGTETNTSGDFLGLPDAKARIYLRMLQDADGNPTPEAPTYFIAADNLAIWNVRNEAMNQPIRIANRGSQLEAGVADYGLVQFYSSLHDEDDFDNLYAGIQIPEPGTLAVFLLGAALLALRRRRHTV